VTLDGLCRKRKPEPQGLRERTGELECVGEGQVPTKKVTTPHHSATTQSDHEVESATDACATERRLKARICDDDGSRKIGKELPQFVEEAMLHSAVGDLMRRVHLEVDRQRATDIRNRRAQHPPVFVHLTPIDEHDRMALSSQESTSETALQRRQVGTHA
jgi:hypothetical protein